jgi:hypothetical protein
MRKISINHSQQEAVGSVYPMYSACRSHRFS